MLNKKIIFMAILLVSLLSLSAVSAAEDATSDIVADTNDEAVLEESIDDAGLADSQNEELEEGDDGEVTPPPIPPSFNLLSDQIVNGGDEVNLTQDYVYQTYSDAHFEKGINITRNVTINGNGHSIDGKNQARIFYVYPDCNVTFKDIIFINGLAFEEDSVGGAILSNESAICTAINCSFKNNAAPNAGAFYGNAINCIFINNSASMYAGAMAGNATNCIFINNSAEKGGAFDYGEATNCTFINNSATYGGAMERGNATTCSFINNSAMYGGAFAGDDYSECYAINCTFKNNNAQNGGAMLLGYAINCTFIENSAEEYCGAFGAGDAINCTFKNNNAKYGGAVVECKATNCSFSQNTARESGGAIYLGNAENCTFNSNSAYSGGAIVNSTAFNCIFTENTASEGGAIVNSTASKCTFTKNIASSNGGAIYSGNASNCTFTQNAASWDGGAIYYGNASNCTFINNSASEGGALSHSNATNCKFTENFATGIDFGCGGGIYNGYASNCTFINNTAPIGGAMFECRANNCYFIENNAELWGGALYSGSVNNSIFIQNSAKYAGAFAEGDATNCTFMLNHAEVGNDVVGVKTTDCKFIAPVFTASDFKTFYNSGEKFKFTLEADGQVLDGVNTIISIYKNDEFVANYTALSGEGWTVKLPAGTYKAVLSVARFDVEPVTKTITVAKNPTAITTSAVTAIYNVNKYLIIKLTDGNGKALSGVKVTVTLGTAKTYTTDKNGQIKINVAKLVPKTYTAKIAYAGNANYAAASKSTKVVVKKATPKMTAKAKSFKVSVKTKNYAITLKDNLGKVMKNTKVTLTVNKKTFTATTNSKGVATFKITNLKKKGKFTATIKYAGNKYYNKLSKKATITAK